MYSGRNISVEMSRQDKLVDGFFSLLHKYCTQERMAAFYASRLCISDKYMMRSIKKQTGQTFHYWMADFILREAKLMLRSTDLSVTEIADKLSFRTLLLSRVFSVNIQASRLFSSEMKHKLFMQG